MKTSHKKANMVDYDLFEKILSGDKGYIQDGDFLDYRIFSLFSKYPTNKVERLFIKIPNGFTHLKYQCEIKCDKCGKIFTVDFSKTKVMEYIKHLRSEKHSKCFCCEECKKESLQQKLEHSLKDEQIRETQIRENTQYYIANYLNTNTSWKANVKLYDKINELGNQYVDWGEIRKYIRAMNYYDFLQTPYWKAISEKVKYKANYRCQICNSNQNLSTHHRTYDNHGDELHNMKDLICICNECHAKHHFE